MPWVDPAAVRGEPPSSSGPPASLRSLPTARFEHLRRLTGPHGLWEHAERTTPRQEHGYCTDDNARAVVAVLRSSAPAGDLDDLAALYLAFVLDARTPAGGFHNRRGPDGSWLDEIGSDDSQGRAWWALGVVAGHARAAWMRDAALDAFDAGGEFGSVHLRTNAYAILGAVEVLGVEPSHAGAETLLRRSADRIADAARSRIPWPEASLAYDNARLPEALLAAGAALGDRRLIAMGLRLLDWLVTVESNGAHFSFTPAGGWTPGEPRPAFDQQPIEAVAMADACHRAWGATGNPVWRDRAVRAVRWFFGLNDTGASLYDATSGGTGDGLMRHGVNDNQGAESTLAGLGALRIGVLCATDGPLAISRT